MLIHFYIFFSIKEPYHSSQENTDSCLHNMSIGHYVLLAHLKASRMKPHVCFGNILWPLAGQHFRGCGCGAPSSFQVYLLIYQVYLLAVGKWKKQ